MSPVSPVMPLLRELSRALSGSPLPSATPSAHVGGFAAFASFMIPGSRPSGSYPTVNPIILTLPFPIYSQEMKSKPFKKVLTFGDLIADFYHTCGKRKGIVGFQGRNGYVLSRGNGAA